MKKTLVVTIACLSLAIGFILGAFSGVQFWQSFDETALETRLMADAKIKVWVLTSLQKSRQDQAIQLLETLLDGDVIGISGVLETSHRKTELLQTLSNVARYREAGNYKSTNPDVASAVQHALERAAQPNNAVKRDALDARPLP